ncbi:hypothetical protein YTPLAS18_22030 [Nitrospira sp.]|nr:hypothetical protein YTPLAS18_22030 [Nitrospira sp.]
MNRNERRAQEKRQRAVGRSGDRIQQAWLEARAHHGAGRLAEAADLYQRILEEDPHHAEAAHLLGLIAYRMGRLTEAVELIQTAIDSAPRQPAYHFNLGVVSQKQGALDLAEHAYRKAVDLHPRYVEALSNLGNLLRDKARYPEAEECYRRAIALSAESPDLRNNLGVVLKELGRATDAQASYEHALRLNPDHLETRNNLGLLWMEAGHYDEARACFEQARRADPTQWKSHYNLGLLAVWQGRHDEAARALEASARLKHDHGRAVRPSLVSCARLKHDEEQIAYLVDRGLLGQGQLSYLDALRRARAAADTASPTETWVRLAPQEADVLASSWNRLLYLGNAPRLAGGALNPSLDVQAVEAQWLAKRPEILYVDHLLSDEALTSLRRFCLEATIWKKEYENGYLGAFIGDGFGTPLLFQIAEELRTRFPRIFKDHRLTQSWSFKHDSARRGLGMHADAAAVNVNFWVTPDEANLDPESGGLLVWDKEAPLEWNFKEYNSEKNRAKIRAFLDQTGARMVRVPYRCNRAVIFNSDLFHETDDVRFRDTYLSRRINITLLYGFRAKE